jgi:prepilin-type N-terminal cleavage/methylation domain-containing protein
MPRQAYGFTLLEVLVAISLMAMVAGSLYGGMYVGIKAHRSATSAVAPARTAALTLELLRQDFDAALPPKGILAGTFVATNGPAGGWDSLVFFSCANVPAEGHSGSDMRKVELSVETAADDPLPVLMRRVTTNLLASNTPLLREQILCRRITTFNIRYFDGTQWLDSWDSAGEDNTLPTAVEVTLEFARDQESQFAPARGFRMSRVYALRCGVSIQDASAEALN